MAYARRFSGGFLDKPALTTPVDAAFLNAVEAALLTLFDANPGAAGMVQVWNGAKFAPKLLTNAEIDSAAAIAKSKLAALNITDADISGAAAIAASKLAGNIAASQLAGYPADASKVLRGDGAWAAPSAVANAVVATTVAGLGAGTDGKIGYLRIGSGTAQRVMQVIYDGTLGKWVSAERLACSSNSNGTFTPAGGTMYPEFGSALHKWADYIAAGLHPQYRVFGVTTVGGTLATWAVGFTYVHVSLDNYPTSSPNDLTRIGTDIVISSPSVAGTPTTAWLGSENVGIGWIDCPIPGSPKDLGGCVFYCQGNGAGPGRWSLSLWERWVG